MTDLKRGWIYKKSEGWWGGWNKRWFVLKSGALQITYSHDASGGGQKVIDLSDGRGKVAALFLVPPNQDKEGERCAVDLHGLCNPLLALVWVQVFHPQIDERAQRQN